MIHLRPLPVYDINFTPLVESNRRAKEKGVSQEEIERATDQFLADARAAVLREDKHLTWTFTTPGYKGHSMGRTWILYCFGWKLRIRRRSDYALRQMDKPAKRWLVSLERREPKPCTA